NNLTMEANVVDPEGNTQNLALTQTAPGRYESQFSPTAEGAYFLRVAGSDGTEETVVGQTSGWVLGYSPEYQELSANPELLASLAEATGGRDLGQITEAVFAHDLAQEATTRPIWPFLLLTAVVLLPFDVAVRRLVVTRADVRRAWAATGGRVFGGHTAVETERTPQMSSLFQAKQRAGTRIAPSDTDPNTAVPPPVQRQDASEKPTASPPPTFIRPSNPPAAPPDNKPASGSGTLASRLLDKKKKDENKGN
ncbi:MAG: hypothetical protein KDD89_04155, partial [Anaerolineales bacterium]|nr:hypothetical protein [Anaerolineales bacterium]